MYASQVVEQLQALIEQHGDQKVVSGLVRTGYGEPVVDVKLIDANFNLMDVDGEPTIVFDLILSHDSACAIGGF